MLNHIDDEGYEKACTEYEDSKYSGPVKFVMDLSRCEKNIKDNIVSLDQT